MKKIKHFLLTLAFLISFTSYSFSQEYEINKLFLKIKNNVEINLEKKNDKVWILFLKKHNILEISKAFRSQEMQQYYLVETESNVNLNTIIEDLKTFTFVEFSERVPVYKFFFTPNDPQYNNQWNLAKIQADQAWNINQGSTAIKIAVIDDGFLLNHEDLASQWHINTNEIPNNNIDDDNNGYIDDWRGWDAADNDKAPSAFNPSNSYFTHGTHVAGIVAAATNNSLGIASIGYNCKLIPVKIGNDATSSLSGAYLGVEYAIVSGAQVMNMSWGGSGFSATYQALFNLAKSKGIVCVAAAGNSSTSMPMYPAAYNNVISVASSTSTDALSSFTNYGTTIDVTAPGSDILSTLAGGVSNYGIFSGTSMASPLVAGICGLMLSNNIGMHPDSVEACLERSCDNIDAQNPTKTGQFGAGRVNAFKALQCTQKAPISNFDVLDTFQCVNTNVRFKSNSSGIQPLTYSWSFPGGNPSSSTLANPSVTYATAGTYSATLTVTNNFGTHSVTKTNIVRIGTPTAKLSGRKYTSYNSNPIVITIDFIGNPPYSVTLTDGSNVWTQNNIISNPYFYSIIPTKDTSIIQIQSFSDKNCVGIGSVVDTIIKLNASKTTMCRDSIEVTSAQNGWQALQNNGIWGNTIASSYCAGTFNSNIGLFPGMSSADAIWGPIINSSNRLAYNSYNQTTTSTLSANFPLLKKLFQLPNGSKIDSIALWMASDDFIDSVWLNNNVIFKASIPIQYGQIILTGFYSNTINSQIPFNELIVKPGDFSGCYGTYFRMKVYFTKPCQEIIDCDTSGLILCMSMDGNANDSTKYNNHGIVRGATPTIGRDGKTNSAYYFNGTTNHINLGVKNILKPSAASISVWVKPQSFNSYIGTNANTIILTKNPNNPGSFMEGYSLYLTNRAGPAKFMTVSTHQPTNNEKWFLSNQNTSMNQWTHLVLTFDFDSIKLYVNGQLDKKIYKGFNNVYDVFDSVVIGYSANIMNKNYFKGDIDELKMYNRVLSSSEILNLYTNPFSCNCTSYNSSNQTDCDTTNLNVGLLAHYKLDGNANDASGNNKNGTSIGGLQYGSLKKSNGAFFDGIDDKININTPILNNISNFTVSGFFKLQEKLTYLSNGGKFGIIYSESINGWNGTGFSVFLVNLDNVNTALYAQWSNGSGIQMQNFIIKSGYIDTGVVYCFNIVRKSDTMYLYIDGNLIEKTYNPYTNAANSNGQIGGNSISSNPSHNGYVKVGIDDIRIYNRALSASEVKGYCGTCNVTPPITIKCDTGKKYIFNKCFNDSIQLNIGKGKNHQWSPAIELSNGSIQNPKCFAKNSRQYLVIYTDSLNCQIIDTFQINVFPSNKISLKDSMVCIGDSLFYSLENNGSIYNWLPNQYISSNNQQSTWIKPLTDITYFVSYKDQNGCNIKDTFDIKTKTCCELKAIFEVSDSIICKEGLVSIFNNSKNIATATYNWTFTNISPSQYTGYSPSSIPLNQQGVYSIKLKTFNGICEDSMTRNIYVIDIKANAGKDSTFCTGTISNLKIGDSNAIADYKYSWAPITGLDNANMASPTVNISQNIQYELSVYDPYTGCVALDTIFLGINNNLDTFKYIDTLCDGDTKVFFGQNITISGIYQHYVKDKLNCDKEVHILSIFFRKPKFSNSIQKACNFYTDKNGVKHTDSFEDKDSTYINGCLTNIHTTKIKILKTRYEEIDMTGCYKMNWKGKTYIDTIKKIDSFTFKDNGCDTLIQYVNLNVVKKAEIKINSTHSNPLNYGEEIILQAFGSNNYKWNTGDIGFQLSHTATKDYQFYVVGYNNVLCPDTAYYNIILSTQSAIELPEIFSPNDDGKNDLFKPNYKGNVQLLDLIIFNRWGEKMFEGHGNEAYWNGKYKGEYQSPGAYIYLFRYILNGNEVSKKGSFVLVR